MFISSSLQNSRVSLQSYSEQLNTISIRSRNVLGNCIHNLNSLALSSRTALASYADTAWGRIGPQFADAQEKLLLIIQWLRELCLRAWHSLQEHTAVVRAALADGSVGKYKLLHYIIKYCTNVSMIHNNAKMFYVGGSIV